MTVRQDCLPLNDDDEDEEDKRSWYLLLSGSYRYPFTPYSSMLPCVCTVPARTLALGAKYEWPASTGPALQGSTEPGTATITRHIRVAIFIPHACCRLLYLVLFWCATLTSGFVGHVSVHGTATCSVCVNIPEYEFAVQVPFNESKCFEML